MYNTSYWFNGNRIALIVVVVLSSTTCKSVQSSEQTMDSALKVTTERLGKDIETHPNSSGEYLLCIQNSDVPSIASKFLVIRIKDTVVLFEQSFFPGYVKWKTESSIEVLSVPGMVKENESLWDFVKIIDIYHGKN